MNESLFRKTSIERITSPEQLNDAIRVANPGVALALCAVGLLLAALLIWSVTGELPVGVEAKGYAQGGLVVCYVPENEARELAPDMEARAGESAATVAAVGDTPLSRREASALYEGDYVVHALGLSDWNVPVTLSAPGVPDGLTDVRITVKTVRPIAFLFSGAET